MTHTNTEQPEAIRLAEELRECHPSKLTELKAASVIISQHANILELEAQTAHMAALVELANYATEKLEAAQAQRTPLTVDEVERIYSRYGGDMVNCTRAIERHHGITQEKQG